MTLLHKLFPLTLLFSSRYEELLTAERQLRKRTSQFQRERLLTTLLLKHRYPLIQKAADHSKAQVGQDLFVLAQLGMKRGGFFVEFGASDGLRRSNTHLLEKHFEWRGILAEPAKYWHPFLMKNRSAIIETNCVWKESGKKLAFSECSSPEHSTIESFTGTDYHRERRKGVTSYDVETISLNDLLQKHNAPSQIDYLSVDTEGSEFEILEKFNFQHHDVSIITCEHNYTPQRKRIYDLLVANGFERKYTELSRFEDWYVSRRLQ